MDLFGNNFFGHLLVEYKENVSRAYFDNCEEECNNEDYKDSFCDEMKQFSSYQLLEETKLHFKISYYDFWLGEKIEKVLYREGDCYYMRITKYNFKEYFCKVTELE